MKTLNILKGELDIAFVALNPTEEAKLNGAVFSTDRGFWNILEKAVLLQKKPINTHYKKWLKKCLMIKILNT